MSTSSNEFMEKGDEKRESGNNLPEWVVRFMENKSFFEKCGNHNDLQKSEVNSRYCISCNASICRYCVTTGHHDHKILTIYRHVYQNVVPLSQMDTHIDCDTIQPYKCNKKWVVSMTPLPHNGSGSLIEGDGACHVCKRKLTDPDRYRFCSIACKVQAILGRGSIVLPTAGEGTSQRRDGDRDEDEAGEDETGGHKRNRKGVPHRAPLF